MHYGAFPSTATRQTIEQAQRGNREALSCIQIQVQSRVRAAAAYYAFATGQDADDLQQEMWLGVLAGLRDVDPTVGDPIQYLLKRGKWKMLEAVRRIVRHPEAQLEESLPLADPRPFEQEVVCDWITTELQQRLRGTQALVLDWLLQGFQQEEIAQRLGCTAANVNYHVRKIRESYRELMAEHLPPPGAKKGACVG
jgi:RNA polymerase sigma factor (sigma-70 family)